MLRVSLAPPRVLQRITHVSSARICSGKKLKLVLEVNLSSHWPPPVRRANSRYPHSNSGRPSNSPLPVIVSSTSIANSRGTSSTFWTRNSCWQTTSSRPVWRNMREYGAGTGRKLRTSQQLQAAAQKDVPFICSEYEAAGGQPWKPRLPRRRCPVLPVWLEVK